MKGVDGVDHQLQQSVAELGPGMDDGGGVAGAATAGDGAHAGEQGHGGHGPRHPARRGRRSGVLQRDKNKTVTKKQCNCVTFFF